MGVFVDLATPVVTVGSLMLFLILKLDEMSPCNVKGSLVQLITLIYENQHPSPALKFIVLVF